MQVYGLIEDPFKYNMVKKLHVIVFPDVDECERDPCPVGSRCVNTRGSFTCECPLGFDLEDGRTCTRGKTLNSSGMHHYGKC